MNWRCLSGINKNTHQHITSVQSLVCEITVWFCLHENMMSFEQLNYSMHVCHLENVHRHMFGSGWLCVIKGPTVIGLTLSRGWHLWCRGSLGNDTMPYLGLVSQTLARFGKGWRLTMLKKKKVSPSFLVTCWHWEGWILYVPRLPVWAVRCHAHWLHYSSGSNLCQAIVLHV